MKKWLLFITLVGGLVWGGVYWFADRASAATTVFSGSLQGGCYLATQTSCKIFVEPFTIAIAPADELLGFRLEANGQLLYDFVTPANLQGPRPTGNYTPSTIALDFGVSCGETYTVNLLALDTGNTDYVDIAQTDSFTCADATFLEFLPLLMR